MLSFEQLRPDEAFAIQTYELQHKKIYFPTCTPNKDTNQPAHLYSLSTAFIVRMKKLCILFYTKCPKWRFWSECTNAEADLNLCWVCMPKCKFSDATPHTLYGFEECKCLDKNAWMHKIIWAFLIYIMPSRSFLIAWFITHPGQTCEYSTWLYYCTKIHTLTFILLNMTNPTFANSVDPDQLASEEANWSGSALFAIKYVNWYQQPGSSDLIG